MSGAHASLSILIPAAGLGTRLGLGPKALLLLDGKPIIRWLADKALRFADQVLIAAPADRVDEFSALCPECICLAGGPTRQQSVAILARASRSEFLLLHDAARPFVSGELIGRVAAAARLTGCAGAFLDPEVPIARITDGLVTAAWNRDQVGVFQAPQAFARALLLDVLARSDHQGWQDQSTMQLALRAGVSVRAVPGEKTNIKLSTKEDWTMASSLQALLR